MRTTYSSAGDALDTFAVLSGSLPLDRTNAAAVATAPAPVDASTDREIQVAHREYDALGLGTLVKETGPNGRCTTIGYDSIYGHLPTVETIYAGGTPPFTANACGPRALATGAAYDRGLGQLTVVTDANSQATLGGYDAFGRLTKLARPNPSGGAASLDSPSTKISYFLPDKTGKPYSVIHTRTEDGLVSGSSNFLESWTVVDGLGRTLVKLNESELTNQWIVSEFLEYDTKGALARSYLPYSLTLSLTENESTNTFSGVIPVGSAPLPYQATDYDAFGRIVRKIDFDGTVVQRNVYRALSTDVYDAISNQVGGPQNTFSTERKDGHGRTISRTERIRINGTPELREVTTQYLPTGEPEVITRKRGTDQVVRWMRYDSLGRMVANIEPNTSANFNASPATPLPSGSTYDAAALKGWRYAYNDAGDWVGTSDARGCGVNFVYDSAGRLFGEDYSPCDVSHAPYSAISASAGTGFEVFYQYDDATVPGASGLTAPVAATGDPTYGAGSANGRLVSMSDRAASRWFQYDPRGRVTLNAVRVASPDAPANGFSERYAPRWYFQNIVFDAADREIHASTGASNTNLLGTVVSAIAPTNYNRSVVSTTYTSRGLVATIAGSYGTLVSSLTRAPDGLISEIKYGDPAQTTTNLGYDPRRRLNLWQTTRAIPSLWSSPPANYLPAPNLSPTTPTSFQLVLQDQSVAVYDPVGNPKEIRDWRVASEWPAGSKPVTRKMTYDDSYRLLGISYEYTPTDDAWVSPFDAENNDIEDPRRPDPSPHVSFVKRVASQDFEYDWLGNTNKTSDDSGGFYDRSLGPITNGTVTVGPDRLVSATNTSVPGATSTGQLTTLYDAAGNLTRLSVQRNGTCLPTGATCSQRFAYDWDEPGRLIRARRWDFTTAQLQPASAALPTTTPKVDLRYAYDGSDERFLKTAVDSAATQVHTAYIFDSLELRRATHTGSPGDYTRDEWTEVPLLVSNGERLGRIWYDDTTVPTIAGVRAHVLLDIQDHLGSSSIVIDKATSELVELSTYQAYGGAESDYRSARWKGFREDYRFTGKEEDVEVGLTYFGKRFYSAALNRWVSADPLAVHVPGEADLNVYAYVHGKVLRAVDPFGLCETNPGAGGCAGTTQSGSPSTGARGTSGTENAAQGDTAPDLSDVAVMYMCGGPAALVCAGGIASGDSPRSEKELGNTEVQEKLAAGVLGAAAGAAVAAGIRRMAPAIAKAAQPAAELSKKLDDLGQQVKTALGKTDDVADTTKGVVGKSKSLEEQAAELVRLNAGRSRVALDSPSRRMEVDLTGKSHAGVKTPHTKVSARNTEAPKHLQPVYNTRNSETVPATKQDIRTVRRYLEREGKR